MVTSQRASRKMTKDSFHKNSHKYSANYLAGSCCCNSLLEHDTYGLQAAPINRVTSSSLVTIPFPVSYQAENRIVREMSPHNKANAKESWEDNEPPEFTFSDATSIEDPSSVNAADSYHLDEVNCGHAYTRDIINCNILDRIKFQAVLHQAGTQIPFAATTPFPRAENAPFSRLKARPVLKEQEVSIIGQLQSEYRSFP